VFALVAANAARYGGRMKPCIRCRRHVRRAESVCLFCGAELRDATASPAFVLWGFGAALLFACGPVSVMPDESTSTGVNTTGGASTSTTATPTTGSTTTTGTSSSTSGCGSECTTGDPNDFIPEPDSGRGGVECDVVGQNCPDGQKCSAWGAGGESWNSAKCVPVTGSQQPGEPCTADGGPYSGIDDCIEGAMCWDVDEQDHGVCVALCTGTLESPKCEPDFGCAFCGSCVLNLCLPRCDPLAQDCEADYLCLPVSHDYLCVMPRSDTGGTFDPCGYANACDAGLICLGPASAKECDQNRVGCCLPMCSIAEGAAACPGEGQECLPVFEPQPEGHEDVGYCTLPM
jgi:hypothetical protein